MIVHNPGGELRLLTDINDDGDLGDLLEDSLRCCLRSPHRWAVTATGAGGVRVLAPERRSVGPGALGRLTVCAGLS